MARMSVPAPALPSDVRRFVLAGVGSSAAHARFLAHLLRDGGLDARIAPISALVAAPDPSAADDVLIVVSQGLSPNARLPLRRASAWRWVLVLTAATEDGARAVGDVGKAELLAELRQAGVTICPYPAGENEYTTLVRVVGPMAGYLCALSVAAAIAPASTPSWDIETICAALEAAPARIDGALSGFEVARLRDGVMFLTTGTYGELADNLRFKVLEGMLLPCPARVGRARARARSAPAGARRRDDVDRAHAPPGGAVRGRAARARRAGARSRPALADPARCDASRRRWASSSTRR